LQTVRTSPVEVRRNLAREYLQVYLLRLLQESGALVHLALVGGTALRLLHRLPRFSEDLDFTLAEADTGPQFEPAGTFADLGRRLARSGYDVKVRMRAGRTVATALVAFPGLPSVVGWTRDPRASLAVKLEVDTRPPAGATIETTLVQRFFPVALRHHDLASMFAGKLHCVLARPWSKGRDWFDLVWYLTEKRGLEPNLGLLRNALRQTGHGHVRVSRWRQAVRARMASLDWDAVLDDARPFLERASDAEQLAPELVRKVLRA
jgi:hypothetical protein